MKIIFNSQVLVIVIMLAWMGSINAQEHMFGTNPNPPSKSFGQTQIIGDNPTPTTISQSTSMTVASGSSVACGYGGGITADGHYYRSFVLSNYGITTAWNVTNVTFGIESANGPDQPITVKLYTTNQPFPTGFPGSLTLLASKILNIPAQSLTLVNVPMIAAVPAGSELVLEIYSPDGFNTSNGFYMGANGLGQSGPSYIASDSCGIPPTPTAGIGFPNAMWVMSVTGTDQLFFDTFDTYTSGTQLACQTANWTTWSAAPCTGEDPVVSSTFAYSGANSVKIVPVNDCVHAFGNKTTGKWYISFMFYIPSGKGGYFNTLNTFPTPGTSSHYGMECYFNADGTGELDTGGTVNFNWQHNLWNMALVVIDLDSPTHQAEFWLSNLTGNLTQLATWNWTRGGTTYANRLAANDFYGPTQTATDEMYFDNYYFSDVQPPIPQLANDVGPISIDLPTQVGPGIVVPKATVKNYGTAANTFNITMTITGGYTSTQTVTGLAAGATQQVTFGNWTASAIGPYTINAYTQLATDGDTSNDTLSQPIYVWDASGDWTTGLDVPQPLGVYLGQGVGYTNGAQKYMFHFAGSSTVLETECYKYDVTGNSWTTIASLPEGRDRFAAAGSGNFIYVIGGYDTNTVATYKNTVFKYDIAGNSWSTVAPLPAAIGWGRAVGYNNRIYFAGGYDGVGYLSSVYVYDVAGNTWSTATSMPGGVFGGGFSVTGNKLVYVAGAGLNGISNTVYVGTIDAGNPLLISWATMDNTFPGIKGKVTSEHGVDLTARMEQSFNTGRSLDAVAYPPGSMYRFEAEPWGTDGIIVAGGSPSSTWVANDPNPCYVYKPATDTWTAQENVPNPITAASAGVVNEGSTWKLILVGGINAAGVLTAGTQIYTQTTAATTFPLTVTVLNGWNMVSIPGLLPTNQNVTTWWPGKDPAAGVFKFAGGYQAVTTVTPGVGYWMKNVGAQTYNTGDEWPVGGINIVAHSSVPALLGWNLIGGYEDQIPTASLTTTPPGLITGSIYKYSGGYVATTTLDPGYGYWVKLTGAGSINFPADAPKALATISTENFGKIIITDNAQMSYTLYAVDNKTDVSQFDLPPYPPQGMFDVRYSSQRCAENLSTEQAIEMTGVQYPVKVKAVGTSIILSDETGKEIARLKAGEEVTINTAGKLYVSGNVIPSVYSLEQNYPNPFNPSTTIQFSIPEDVQNVKLIIYSALGEKVAELVNTGLQAGVYKYNWNAY